MKRPYYNNLKSVEVSFKRVINLCEITLWKMKWWIGLWGNNNGERLVLYKIQSSNFDYVCYFVYLKV